MADSLLDALQLPDSCRLGARITKKMLLENAKVMPADRRAITNDLETVIWQYTLKPSTIAIMPFADDEREYDEIAVLEAILKSPRNASRIAEVIHRSIPYPVVLVLEEHERQQLSLAPKRFSRSEKGATVAEEFRSTGWLDLSSPSAVEATFMESLRLTALPQSNYLMLYAALLDRVTALQSACRTGEYHVFGGTSHHEQRQLLLEAEAIENQVREHRAAIARETQFNRKVELNMKIKRLEERLDAVGDALRAPKGEV